MTLSRMFCEKFQTTPGIFCSSSAFMAAMISCLVRARFGPQNQLRQPVLFDQERPVFLRPQRHEVFAVVEAGRVGAVVGPAELGDDRLHLGVGGHDGPRLPGDLDLALQRDVERRGAANPQVAFFQLGHELAAHATGPGMAVPTMSERHDDDGRPAILQTDLELPEVAELQDADQEVLADRLEVLEEKHAQAPASASTARISAPAREKA